MFFMFFLSTHPKTLWHIAIMAFFFFPLYGFLVGQVQKLTTVLIHALANFQFSEIDIGILVLDILGIEGI